MPRTNYVHTEYEVLPNARDRREFPTRRFYVQITVRGTRAPLRRSTTIRDQLKQSYPGVYNIDKRDTAYELGQRPDCESFAVTVYEADCTDMCKWVVLQWNDTGRWQYTRPIAETELLAPELSLADHL